MNDAHARLRYLDRTVDLLFPGPGEPRPYTLLPHRLLPRRLVPRAWWHPGRRVMVRRGGIESHLSEIFGIRLRVTLRVPPARRANRKPILEAHAPDGPIAFVKIGDTDLTRELVAHEARTLGLLAGVPLKTVVPPAVLHHGSWRGLSVLALTPLPVRRGRIRDDVLTAAITEIAHVPAGPFPGTGLPGPPGPLETPASRFAWHGDLTSWNISRGPDGRLLVWDWERFGTGVPLGFDAVHHFFHRALRRQDPVTAAGACVARSLRILAPFGLSAAESRLTALRYLIALADRHAADGHAPLGPPEAWLSPVLDGQESLL
ncbi:hypothetical protein [Streptosporangium longisporum]|uniref:Aminoglycoside phosphotransferase domain-containing protein n=1 Tax=Streptosporangium longisporum TaxID=46187 RepID=A0ABP6KMY0_9ACTN